MVWAAHMILWGQISTHCGVLVTNCWVVQWWGTSQTTAGYPVYMLTVLNGKAEPAYGSSASVPLLLRPEIQAVWELVSTPISCTTVIRPPSLLCSCVRSVSGFITFISFIVFKVKFYNFWDFCFHLFVFPIAYVSYWLYFTIIRWCAGIWKHLGI